MGVPQKTADKLLFLSDRKCCVCQKEGVQIHHIHDSNDHSIENLACLCHPHHDEASITGSLTRKLSAGQIKMFRELHYKKVYEKRHPESKKKSYEKNEVIKAMLTAQVLFEIDRIEHEYYSARRENKADVLSKIRIHDRRSNEIIALDILQFLGIVSYEAHHDMNRDTALEIYSLILQHLIVTYNETDSTAFVNGTKYCIDICEEMVLGGLFDMNNYAIAATGLLILKYVYRLSRKLRIHNVEENCMQLILDIKYEVRNNHDEELIAEHLDIVETFQKDFKNGSRSYPVFSLERVNNKFRKDSDKQ